MSEAVLLAMSGGIDSSIAVHLLQNSGFKVIGVTFKTFSNKQFQSEIRKSTKFITDAKIIAEKFKIPHYVINVEEEFELNVINYFTEGYLSGKTPNPCIVCNQVLKWKTLFDLSNKLNCKYIATGHYVCKKFENGRFFLSEAFDTKKDQTFFLWNLTQNYLEKTLFPLSQFEKSEIKKIAETLNLPFLTEKKESFGICFLDKNNYKDFIYNRLTQNQIENSKGFFVNSINEIIGEHKGIYQFTTGQKVKIKDETMFVLSIDNVKNTINLGEIDKLYKTKISIEKINLQKSSEISELKDFTVAYSYYFEPVKCRIQNFSDEIFLEFEKPIYAPTIGQSIVFYDDNDLIGGAFIKNIDFK